MILSARWSAALLLAGALFPAGLSAGADEPPAVNPFGPRPQAREDMVPGYIELSDGAVYPGMLSLTLDHRLRIFDNAQKRFREVPLQAIQRIECRVEKEWNEKEWRFKENANDKKVFTGRTYPVREYEHTIVFRSGTKIRGPLSGIIYVQKSSADLPERFLFHKRDKGPVGGTLKALGYVRSVCLGKEALKEGQEKAKKPRMVKGK